MGLRSPIANHVELEPFSEHGDGLQELPHPLGSDMRDIVLQGHQWFSDGPSTPVSLHAEIIEDESSSILRTAFCSSRCPSCFLAMPILNSACITNTTFTLLGASQLGCRCFRRMRSDECHWNRISMTSDARSVPWLAYVEPIEYYHRAV